MRSNVRVIKIRAVAAHCIISNMGSSLGILSQH